MNVWAPADADGRPVMVWIHGGAFVRGANSLSVYDGSAFARDGVVLVSVNHRLGAPGFAVLDGAPTNLGLRDQIAALEWVRDDVAAFGGNADDVTVFGESAGGMSVATLMAAPAAGGLFHRAVVQSGGATAVCELDDARRVSAELAAHLGVSPTAEDFAALDPDLVTQAQTAVGLARQADPDPRRWGPTVSLFPVIDGEIVPDVPLTRIADGAASEVSLLIGTTREEFRLFLVPTGAAGALTSDALSVLALRYGWPATAIETYAGNRPGSAPGDIACAVLTEAGFRVPAIRLADAQHAAGGSVYAYELAWRTPVADLGACHGLDLAFIFDTLGRDAPMAGHGAPTELAKEMHGAWVRFAVDGTPGWQPWTPDDQAVMTFDTQPSPRACASSRRARPLALRPAPLR